MKESKVDKLAFERALRIIEIAEELNKVHQYELASQLLRAGTSVGANIREAQYAESMRDFVHKMNIALKECAECVYWLQLLKHSKKLSDFSSDDDIRKATDILWMLRAIVKTSRSRIEQENRN